jgi:hypothetical protein
VVARAPEVEEVTWADLFGGKRKPVPTRWTDPQREFIESDLHLPVFWGCNSGGKSMVLAEIARRAIRGQLHWQTPGQPYSVLVVGNTWAQLGSTLRYLFDGIEPGEFRDGIRYEGGTIKGQRMMAFDVIGGPGAGGELRCGIFRARNLAGPRYDVIVSDEPLPRDVHGELWPRLLSRNGRMYVTFTPTLGTAGDIDYLWALVDDAKIPWAGEVRVPMTVANCTPRGGLLEVPFVRQVEIDRLRDGVSPIEADMRMGLSRHPRLDCTYFDGAWDPTRCRVDHVPPSGTRVLVGTDHGSKAQAQVSSLIFAEGRGIQTHYHVADMYMSTGRTEMAEDAVGIIAMLRRNGLAHRRIPSAAERRMLRPEVLPLLGTPESPFLDLSDVDLWMGDRSHGGYRGGLGAKSNGDMQRAIAYALGYDVDRLEAYRWREALPMPLQKIRQPRKRHRSMWDGMENLRRLLPSRRLTISVRAECDPMAAAFERWAGALLDPLRDRLDAVRYPIIEVDSGRWRPVG